MGVLVRPSASQAHEKPYKSRSAAHGGKGEDATQVGWVLYTMARTISVHRDPCQIDSAARFDFFGGRKRQKSEPPTGSGSDDAALSFMQDVGWLSAEKRNAIEMSLEAESERGG